MMSNLIGANLPEDEHVLNILCFVHNVTQIIKSDEQVKFKCNVNCKCK